MNKTRKMFEVFRENLANAMNFQKQELGTARYGVTTFSDMEQKEFLRVSFLSFMLILIFRNTVVLICLDWSQKISPNHRFSETLRLSL
jgi:hypothetical protein